MKPDHLAVATFLCTVGNTLVISDFAFSQSTRNAVCVYSILTQPREEALIDDKCQVQQVDDNTTLIQWSDGITTRVEVTWNVNSPRSFEGTIDGTEVSGFGYSNLNESCFSWNTPVKQVCFRYPTQKPQLSPGIYSLGNKSISIFSRDGRYCWIASSRHGSNIQSLKASSTDLNTYIPEYFGGFLYTINSTTITWGEAEYTFESEISNVPADVQRCLNSSQPFFE